MDGQFRTFGDDVKLASEAAMANVTASPSADVLEAVTRELVSKLAHQLPEKIQAGSAHEVPSDGEIEDFCTALTEDTGDRASQIFDGLRVKGKTPETICLGYIATAARRLGECWTTDSLGFLDVTLGMVRLHSMQREMLIDLVPRGVEPTGLKALFAPAPTETHVLGVVMAAGFFRRAGWSVDINLEPEGDAIVEAAEAGKYDLIGLSAGCRAVLPELRAMVPRLKGIVPRPRIVLGGYVTELEPGIASSLELDGDLTDVTKAPFSYQRMLTSVNEH